MAVAHVPADPGQAYAFAGSISRNVDVVQLWHRATASGSWDPVALPDFSVGEMVDHVLSAQQAGYDWHVSVPLEGDDTIYLGAIELVKGVRSGNDFDWSDISSRIDHGDSIHPDQHTMAFDPQQPHVIYAGNDGGIFRSTDEGDSWESLNAGLVISEVEYLAQRPDERIWILAGLQDNGTIRREAESSWRQVELGDGGDCGTNMAHPDICFQSRFRMQTRRSIDRGDHWQPVTPPDNSPPRNMLFYPPLEVHDDVVAKAGQIVHVSSDKASTWADVRIPQSPGLVTFASALAIPTTDSILVATISRAAGGISLAASGDVFAINRDNGAWGQPHALTRPGNGWISDLLVDPTNPRRYWVTYSNPGRVFRSDDAGATWANVTANLPQIPVNAVVSDPASPDRVWVACDVGVFETTNAGGSWSVFGTELPNALAVDLLFYETERLLRVGTRSRGVWEVAVD
jgi:hypothetical protein